MTENRKESSPDYAECVLSFWDALVKIETDTLFLWSNTSVFAASADSLCVSACVHPRRFLIFKACAVETCAATQLEVLSQGDQTFGASHSANGLNELILLDMNIGT